MKLLDFVKIGFFSISNYGGDWVSNGAFPVEK